MSTSYNGARRGSVLGSQLWTTIEGFRKSVFKRADMSHTPSMVSISDESSDDSGFPYRHQLQVRRRSKVSRISRLPQLSIPNDSRLRRAIDAVSSYLHLHSSTEESRTRWSTVHEYRLCMIGFTVGIGNFMYFPSMTIHSDGLSFLIPYLIIHILIGVPLVMMETALGQYSGKSAINAWGLNPSAKGIGISMILLSLTVSCPYAVTLSYSLLLMFSSWREDIPWVTCRNEWQLVDGYFCEGDKGLVEKCSNATMGSSIVCACSSNVSYDFNAGHSCFRNLLTYDQLTNRALTEYCTGLRQCTDKVHGASYIYFFNDVLQQHFTAEDIGFPIWYLVLCLLTTWTLVVLTLYDGLKSAVKVAYFTTCFPLIALVLLLVLEIKRRLETTGFGILARLVDFNVNKLNDIKLWESAMLHVLFSLSMGEGGWITFASYKHFKQNLFLDTVIITMADVVTSFVAGVTVLLILEDVKYDFKSALHDKPNVVDLTFVKFPEALSRAYGWSSRFFISMYFCMVFCIGFSSLYLIIHHSVISIVEVKNELRKYRYQLTIVIAFGLFLLGLPLTTPAGIHLSSMLNKYGYSYVTLIVVFFETIVVVWLYGASTLLHDIEAMIGYRLRPRVLWMISYLYLCPIVIGLAILFSMAVYQWPTYPNATPYSVGIHVLCWLIFIVNTIPIPIRLYRNASKSPELTVWKTIQATGMGVKWQPQTH